MRSIAARLRGEKCVRECFESAISAGRDWVQLKPEAKALWREHGHDLFHDEIIGYLRKH